MNLVITAVMRPGRKKFKTNLSNSSIGSVSLILSNPIIRLKPLTPGVKCLILHPRTRQTLDDPQLSNRLAQLTLPILLAIS